MYYDCFRSKIFWKIIEKSKVIATIRSKFVIGAQNRLLHHAMCTIDPRTPPLHITFPPQHRGPDPWPRKFGHPFLIFSKTKDTIRSNSLRGAKKHHFQPSARIEGHLNQVPEKYFFTGLISKTFIIIIIYFFTG